MKTGVVMTGGMVLGADLLSKQLTSGTRCTAVICSVTNDAFILGTGGGGDATVLPATAAGMALAVGWIYLLSWKTGAFSRPGAALMIAGIVGNLVDRAVLGHVRDFLVLPGVAVVNLADIAVVVGMVLIVIATARSLQHQVVIADLNHPTMRGGER